MHFTGTKSSPYNLLLLKHKIAKGCKRLQKLLQNLVTTGNCISYIPGNTLKQVAKPITEPSDHSPLFFLHTYCILLGQKMVKTVKELRVRV